MRLPSARTLTAGTLAGLVVAAVLGVGGPTEDAPGGPGRSREGPARESEAAVPTPLRGRDGAPEAGRGDAGRTPPPTPGDVPVDPLVGAGLPLVAPPLSGGPPSGETSDGPIAPGTIDDLVAGSAPPPIEILRSDLLGPLRPYGVLDVGGAREPRWSGVARLGRPESPAAEGETADAPTTAVLGVVIDASGTPVDGAEVILYSAFYLRHAYYDHRVREIGRCHTDAEGRFDLRPLDLDTVHFGGDGELLLTIRHPALADVVAQRVVGAVPGRESDVGVYRLGTRSVVLRGAIVDLAGRPVPGAVVRASGWMNPVDYDKTERMVVLRDCPAAVADAEGRYVLSDFAPGVHEISIHVNIDCVLHERAALDGELEWTRYVRAGNGVRGRVLDPEGEPVAAAVVVGGGNWTPTNADGTFWLDNLFPGPQDLEVFHHAFASFRSEDVATGTEADVILRFAARLPRVTLRVVDGEDRPVPLIAIDWRWQRGPSPFTPDSRYWNDAGGRFLVIVPEGTAGAAVSDAVGGRQDVPAEGLVDGAVLDLRLEPPAVPVR